MAIKFKKQGFEGLICIGKREKDKVALFIHVNIKNIMKECNVDTDDKILL